MALVDYLDAQCHTSNPVTMLIRYHAYLCNLSERKINESYSPAKEKPRLKEHSESGILRFIWTLQLTSMWLAITATCDLLKTTYNTNKDNLLWQSGFLLCVWIDKFCPPVSGPGALVKKIDLSQQGGFTTSWLYYTPPLSPTVTTLSSMPCSNKHEEKTFIPPLSTNVLWIPSSSFSLFVFPTFILWWETSWPDVSHGATFAKSTTHMQTHKDTTLVQLGSTVSVCMLILCPLGCDSAAVYSWSPSMQTVS